MTTPPGLQQVDVETTALVRRLAEQARQLDTAWQALSAALADHDRRSCGCQGCHGWRSLRSYLGGA